MARKRDLPPNIYRNPGGRLRVIIRHEGQAYSLGTFATVTDARAALALARADLIRGTFVPPAEKRRRRKAEQEAMRAQTAADSRTVRELAEEWLEWKKSTGLKVGSLYTYRRNLETHFLSTFGDRRVSDVTPTDLDGWLDDLEASKGDSVVSSVHRTVSAVYKYATGDETGLPRRFKPWILASPVPPLAARRFRRAPQVTRNRTVLSRGDLLRLAACMEPRTERLLVLLAGICAFRLGEVLALRRRHVSTDAEGVTWITVDSQVQARGTGVRLDRTKSAASDRTIPVPPALAVHVAAHLEDHVGPDPEDLLFPRKGPGNRLNNPNTVRKRFNAALVRLNASRGRTPEPEPPVEDFTFHGLRHTALTRLGQAGATAAELKAYAGHSDSKSVEIYQHAEKRRLASLTNRM